jgi:putative polysaccharide biosynthesis protein
MVGSHLGAKLLNVRRWLDVSRSVHRTYGKSRLAQIREITYLHFGQGQLSAGEYYNYGLYNDHIFSPAAKREFVGGRWAKRWYGLLNGRLWRATADDKLVCHAMLEGLKLPLPCPYAIFHPGGRFFGSVPCFRQAKPLADYLRHEIPYPFFAKPIHGAHGRGTSAVMALDPSLDRLVLANGDEVAVEQYVAGLSSSCKYGHLFQELLRPDPLIEEICGVRASSIRMMVLLCSDGPHLIRAIWKVPVGGNMTDNFNHGLSGNMLGQVDPETGLVKRVIRNVGLEQAEVAVHPDTAKPLAGFVLPKWDDAVRVSLAAAAALPGLHFQYWDIALCPQGPVILEVNAHGDLDLAQHAYRAGLYDAQFRALLAGLRR